MFEPDDSLLLPDNQRTRSDAQRNHRLLLDTARRLFDEHGVDAVSMTQIAQEAGVGKGTLYRNFDNKVELCYALLDEDQRELQDSTLARLRTQNTPTENLHWFVEQAAMFVIRNNTLLYAGAESLQAVTLELPAHMWWRQTINNLLTTLADDMDVDYLSDVFYTMLHVNTIRFQMLTLGYHRDRILAGLHSLLDALICEG